MKPIASYRPPLQGDRTWFGSGRAALIWLLRDRLKARRLLLPAIVCPALAEALRLRLPALELEFYGVGADLRANYPAQLDADSALVITHYFGYHAEVPRYAQGWVIEDRSHTLLKPPQLHGAFAFASLRKLYPVADGGEVLGSHRVRYEPDTNAQGSDRQGRSSWAEAQQDEQALDRWPPVCDISSASLRTVLSTDTHAAVERRRRNESLLRDGLPVGAPLPAYSTRECPLTHLRLFESERERDWLRQRLMDQGIYTSIQWPTSRQLPPGEIRQQAETWARLHLAFPVGEHLDDEDMLRIIDACSV